MNNAAGAKSTEKLSSGMRINRAGDDAAGLSISEKMRGQIRGLNQASSNAQDGISLIQTAEGALNETHAILQRMRELSVQSSNGTLDDTVDRAAIDKEVNALKEEVQRIADQTTFNGKTLLSGNIGGHKYTASTGFNAGAGIVKIEGGLKVGGDGAVGSAAKAELEYKSTGFELTITQDGKATTYTSGAVTAPAAGETKEISIGGFKLTLGADFVPATAIAKETVTSTATGTGNMTFQIGADSNQTMAISIDSMDKAGLGIGAVTVGTQANATSAITTIDDAINKVSTQRADLGASQNRLEHTIKNLDNGAENLQAAASSCLAKLPSKLVPRKATRYAPNFVEIIMSKHIST